jgi:predicted Rossmann-fold nucleotide-binding protein
VGTLEEAVEAITWTQLGIQAKGVVFLDVQGYWTRFMSVLDQMVDEGFVRPDQRRIAQIATSPEEALDKLASFRSPVSEIWLGPEET